MSSVFIQAFVMVRERDKKNFFRGQKKKKVYYFYKYLIRPGVLRLGVTIQKNCFLRRFFLWAC